MAKIHVSHLNSMSDTTISIKASGLSPKKVFSLHSSTEINPGSFFECVVQYEADAKGCINLNCHEALSGNYTGIEPMGLFWAMEGSPSNKNKFARFAKLDITTPLVVNLSVYSGKIANVNQFNLLRNNGDLEKDLLTSTEINRLFMAPGTKRIPLTVAKDGIHGTLFVPPGQGPFPAVILMFGSYAGTMEYKAALLSSHGFVTLALAFHGAPGLPSRSRENEHYFPPGGWQLKLEYFEKATEWLIEAPKVDKFKGHGVICLSASGFIGLAMATFLPEVRCVISLNGNMYVEHCTLTYKGREFLPVSHLMKGNPVVGKNGEMRNRYKCPLFDQTFELQSPAPEDMDICFYKCHNVAFMFMAGLSDAATASEHNVNRAERLLRIAGHQNFKVLRYPGAGHLLEPPFSTHNKATTVHGKLIDWGGVRLPHCRAQEDSWQRQIEFLHRNLTFLAKSKI